MIAIAAVALAICCHDAAAGVNATDFVCLGDSLTVWMQNRTGVVSKVVVQRVLRRSGALDMYFTQDLGDYPWRQTDLNWFKSVLRDSIPKGERLGEVFVRNLRLDDFVVPEVSEDGKPQQLKYTRKEPARSPLVKCLSDRSFAKGLEGRHIALWQSHGRYFDNESGTWKWQRATLNRTVEDLYTQSYVLKFLMPMLENSGADVYTPRERDTQPMEYIVDNDPSFEERRSGLMRRNGRYSDKGGWTTVSEGFADVSRTYGLTDNPFSKGTARRIGCSPKSNASAKWTARIETAGRYAVYVSYKSFENSASAAAYSVRHSGGETSFSVDQRMSGGTWVYLGTFGFRAGEDCVVTLSAKGRQSEVVCADAVKIGGGMGKVARGDAGVSGVASYMEGALYSMPWYGVDSLITTAWDDDYTNDFADRGPWVKMMRDDRKVPMDLALAFHSDAGLTPNDSIVGTLAIYSLLAEGKRKFADGHDRGACRVLADYVQSEVCADIRDGFDSEWTRRQIWNKSYSECRTPDVPAMILELLSHQNFADMRLGLDPSFQFVASRAVYKGILKFLSDMYDVPYAVQPLPVREFAARLQDGNALLRWTDTADPSEPTAVAKGYRVYTRVDDGGFDNGVDVASNSACIRTEPGHVYSFKVVAWNDGGYSFPSEILSVGRPKNAAAGRLPVVIVNNFTRVGGPTWVDSPMFAGFDAGQDCGVPYIDDISFVGEVYDLRRDHEWLSDYAPGAGACYDDRAGEIIAGNTFDYPYVHGKSLMELGYPFYSMSASAFCNAPDHTEVLDLICGKQVTTMTGRGQKPARYRVFPEALRKSIEEFVASGGNVIVSGADIATDIWLDVFPSVADSAYSADAAAFAKNILGYKFLSDNGTNRGSVSGMPFHNEMNSECYCVEHPDAIAPAGKQSATVLTYDGTGRSAAVAYDAGEYRTMSFGFPVEVLKSHSDRTDVLRMALEFVTGQSGAKGSASEAE